MTELFQACHATTAVMHLFKDDPHVQTYLSDVDNMHKVVLAAPDADALTRLHEALREAAVDHKLWVEQPEDVPTCLAAKPAPKVEVQKYFKKFKLFSVDL
ncbi:putative peptidyl-tRNA hydrolase PTRHD1 [Amphibalanus amphitrite]|uniref:peptidyl-tRNA hydrolase n=1 Tax=Amphibalanus amphitrite TaxID=1232801 RepID=A0A6A4W474_AMPAM|nr:putative peptidyl-tRNA hydrolase PTRHD1 [Amphibalanus amphitrite]